MNAQGMRRLLKGEDGQMIIAMALLSLMFVALVAVVLDSGFVYFEKRNLQNAADAAALAGAQSLDGLSSSQAPAETAALDYAGLNITDTNSVSAVVQNGYTEIEVTVRKNATTAFLDFFGTREVTAKARARIASPLLPGPGVVPLAIDLETYENCTVDGQCTGVTLKEESGNNSNPRNSYGLLDLGGVGGGASEVRNYFVGGSTVAITDPDNEKQGNVSSMRQAVEDRMTAAAHNNCLTFSQVTDSNGFLIPRCNPLFGARKGADSAYPNAQPTAVIIIPVITDFSGTGCSGSHCVDIVGTGSGLRTFAIFLLDETTYHSVNGVGPTCADSGQCWITGRFIMKYLAPVSTQFDLPTGSYTPSALLKIVQLVD